MRGTYPPPTVTRPYLKVPSPIFPRDAVPHQVPSPEEQGAVVRMEPASSSWGPDAEEKEIKDGPPLQTLNRIILHRLHSWTELNTIPRTPPEHPRNIYKAKTN